MKITWLGPVAAGALAALGCGGPVPSSQTAAPAPESPARVTPTTIARPSVRQRLAPAVAMPGGGVRIDTRAETRHARALERQPDGSYRHVCVDAPEMAEARGAR